MVWRILQFVLGAALAGGGSYLAWTQRASVGSLLPPGPSGLPLVFMVSLFGVASGIVFIVSAIHPRPNQRRARAAAAARDESALQEADRYYSERARAADRDWRASEIVPPVAPQPVPPPPPPAKQVQQPVAVQSLAAAPPPQPVLPPVIVAPTVPPAPAKPAPPVSPQVQVMPVAPANPFPASVTLAPLPRAEVASGEPALAGIRAAIAEGRLPDAERLLNAARETAVGLDLARLTAIAGDHAAASGQVSHARWLWRLALKRFGEHDALATPEARAVQDSLAK